MEMAGFQNDTADYVATGLLTYDDQNGMRKIQKALRRYSSNTLTKEMFLPASVLHKLNPEQNALLDFLVLIRCKHFVGISVSTYSVLVREYRHLHGIAPRNTTWLVDGSKVGTEGLFFQAAVFDS
jgi:hypothetical protein